MSRGGGIVCGQNGKVAPGSKLKKGPNWISLFGIHLSFAGFWEKNSSTKSSCLIRNGGAYLSAEIFSQKCRYSGFLTVKGEGDWF